MIRIPKINSLPFYESLEEQYHRLPQTYGQFFGFVYPLGFIPPFKLKMLEVSSGPISIELIDSNDRFIAEIRHEILAACGMFINIQSGLEFVCRGNILIDFPYPLGRYYLKVSYGGDVIYSEVFTVVSSVSEHLKVEYSSSESLSIPDYGTYSFDDGFKLISYLDAHIGKPDYPFEEELVRADGVNVVEKQLSEKVFKFTFLAPEFLCDSLRILRMCDNVVFKKLNKKYCASYILLTPKWEEVGDLASVEVEFNEDTIIKRLPNILNVDCSCECDVCTPILGFVTEHSNIVCSPILGFVEEHITIVCSPVLGFVKEHA